MQVRFFDLEVFGGQGSGADDDRTEPVETAVRAYKSGNTFFIEDIEAHDQYRRMRTGRSHLARTVRMHSRVWAIMLGLRRI